MKRFCSLLLCFLLSHSVLCAQNRLTKQLNSLRSDSINREMIPVFDAGCEGEHVTWDFSADVSEDIPDTTCVSLYNASGRFLWDDDGTMTTYRELGDSLVITREETPLYEMDFDIPVLRMTYPFCYGFSISSPFSGHGIYEETLAMSEMGTSIVKGDAFGTLILSKGDTLQNVLRVHTVLESKVDISNKETRELVGILSKITDTYEWYARGYRYPVLKTTANYIMSNDSITDSSSTAQRISPEMQMEVRDEYNELLRDATCSPCIVNVGISVHGSVATVTYDLNEDACISITLADSKGIVYWRYEDSLVAGEGYTTDIPLSGLLRGQYAVCINANGDICNYKVNIE